MCVIADAERAVALGGVMGGADTEVSDTTTDLLIEAADFDPARRFAAPPGKLQPAQRLVVSLRARRRSRGNRLGQPPRCELILELAGGELCEGRGRSGARRSRKRRPISLRFAQAPAAVGH